MAFAARVFGKLFAASSLLALGFSQSDLVAQTEAPVIIKAFPNAPRWATLEWRHTGGGVYAFVIEHETTAVAVPDAAKRIWTITELQANTTYRFRVCAVFAYNRVCSDYAAVRTFANPPPPPTPPPVPPPTPTPPPASSSSLLSKDIISFQSINFPGRFIRHRNWLGELTTVTSELDRRDATFLIRPALDGTAGANSLESIHLPGHFLRHKDFKIRLDKNDNLAQFKKDASFLGLSLVTQRTLLPTTLESTNVRGHYIRHSNFKLVLSRNDGSNAFWQDAPFLLTPNLSATAPAGAFSFEAGNAPGLFLRHRDRLGVITPVATPLDKSDANFLVRRALNGNNIGVSFESVNHPGNFLRHQNYRIKLQPNDNTSLFRDDASFLISLCDPSSYCRVTFEASNAPGHYIRHKNFELWLGRNDAQMGGDSAWQIQPAR